MYEVHNAERLERKNAVYPKSIFDFGIPLIIARTQWIYIYISSHSHKHKTVSRFVIVVLYRTLSLTPSPYAHEANDYEFYEYAVWWCLWCARQKGHHAGHSQNIARCISVHPI